MQAENMSKYLEETVVNFAGWISFIYILHILIPFLLGGDFPSNVSILHMYPCIENRYVPLLGTRLFSPMTLVSS